MICTNQIFARRRAQQCLVTHRLRVQNYRQCCLWASFWDILQGIVTNDNQQGQITQNVTNGLAMWQDCISFACCMDERQKETLRVRLISVAFACLALAIFQPMGLGELGVMLYVHLLAILMLGVVMCYVTEALVKYILRMPATLDNGVNYIIRRNLRFQLINTPLEALLICTYFHFPMSAIDAPDPLSPMGFLKTLLLLAFCSFAIGLYWRYKFRSRYLALELEETKRLNEQLHTMQQQAELRAKAAEAANLATPHEESTQPAPLTQATPTIVLTGTTSETVTLKVADLLYVEAVGNYTKVYQWRDDQVHCDMLRATSRQIEEDLKAYPTIIRCHRAFLVNLGQVDRIVSHAGTMQLLLRHTNESIPVSRSRMAAVKQAVLS